MARSRPAGRSPLGQRRLSLGRILAAGGDLDRVTPVDRGDHLIAVAGQDPAGHLPQRARGGCPAPDRLAVSWPDRSAHAESAESGANPAAVRMAEFVEDAHGAFPRVASRIEVTSGAVGFAEADENAGFEVAVAEFTEQAGRTLIAADRLPVVAEVMVAVTEAVPGVRLAVPVPDLAEQRQRLPAVRECLVEVFPQGKAPPEPVECPGFPGPVPRRAEQAERLPGMVGRPGEASLQLGKDGEVTVRVGLADQVAGFPVQLKGVAEMGAGIAVAAQRAVSTAQVEMGPAEVAAGNGNREIGRAS